MKSVLRSKVFNLHVPLLWACLDVIGVYHESKQEGPLKRYIEAPVILLCWRCFWPDSACTNSEHCTIVPSRDTVFQGPYGSSILPWLSFLQLGWIACRCLLQVTGSGLVPSIGGFFCFLFSKNTDGLLVLQGPGLKPSQPYGWYGPAWRPLVICKLHHRATVSPSCRIGEEKTNKREVEPTKCSDTHSSIFFFLFLPVSSIARIPSVSELSN